jgi:hypothetical protein
LETDIGTHRGRIILAGSELHGSPGRRNSSRHSGIIFTLC